jgi:hypothetical protein
MFFHHNKFDAHCFDDGQRVKQPFYRKKSTINKPRLRTIPGKEMGLTAVPEFREFCPTFFRQISSSAERKGANVDVPADPGHAN